MRSALAFLVLLLQYKLWFGESGIIDIWSLRSRLAQEQTVVQRLQTRNASLAAEVLSLHSGYEAIEERARNELGLIKRNERFIVLG